MRLLRPVIAKMRPLYKTRMHFEFSLYKEHLSSIKEMRALASHITINGFPLRDIMEGTIRRVERGRETLSIYSPQPPFEPIVYLSGRDIRRMDNPYLLLSILSHELFHIFFNLGRENRIPILVEELAAISFEKYVLSRLKESKGLHRAQMDVEKNLNYLLDYMDAKALLF